MAQEHLASIIHILSLIIIALCQHGRAEKGSLKVSTRECVCSGDNIIVTYECTVFGGAEVITVWKGDFFDCSTGKREIELVHREDFSPHICNEGNVTVVARIVRVENDSFISQLNITLTHDIAGKSIECISDNGTNTERVGSMNLTSAILPLPPENINWIITNHQQLDMIIFMWSARCHSPSLDHQATYKIIASRDCGCCPTTTNNTTVICTDLPVDGSVCTLAIQTVVCGITGELSHNISVQVDVSNKSRRSSRISPALVSAITLGVALAVSLVGFTTVTILLIKSKITVQSTCTAAIVTLDKIASERDMSVENRSIHDITTNENIAYVVH